MTVYSLGATVGGGTALILGGVIIEWMTSLGTIALPVFGELAVWQTVFLLVGLPGLVLLAAGVLAMPPGVIATTSGNPSVFLVVLGIFITLITSIQACSLSSLNMVTPNQLRGTGVALFSTVVGLVGSAGGGVAVPFIAQTFYRGDTAIGYGMATLIAIACPVAAIALGSGLRAMRIAMAEIEAVD